MKHFVLALGIIMCFASVLVADEVEFDATEDSKVNEDQPTTNYGSEEFFTIWGGQELVPTPAEIGLVEFHGLNELTAAGAKIDGAILRLHVTTLVQTGEAEIYRIADPWDEGMVTWNTRPVDNRDIIASNKLPNQSGVWFETEVTDIVKSWVEDGFPNNGFYVGIPLQGNSVGAQFATKEHPDPDISPKLFVEYHFGGGAEEEAASGSEFHVSPISTSAVGINFSLPVVTPATLKVYDASGALVETLVDGSVASGDHTMTWNGAPGIYFVRLEVGNTVFTEKTVIVN